MPAGLKRDYGQGDLHSIPLRRFIRPFIAERALANRSDRLRVHNSFPHHRLRPSGEALTR
jgi:hypothetical protein